LTVRTVYLQANTRSTNADIELDDRARLKAYGVAANLDFDNWFVLSELTQQTRDYDGYRITTPALTVGAGYRLGAWTPFVNFAKYTERTTDSEAYAPTSWRRASLTLRYDIDPRSSVKAQFDRHQDLTRNFGDTVSVVRVAYDRLV
jgi:predicted porin